MWFIAGGTGFVGSYLLKSLKEKGIKVRCLVRSDKGAEKVKLFGGEPVYGDITDKKSIRGFCENVSIVIHLVGIIKEKKGMSFHKVHLQGTENLVNEAKSSGVKIFFYQSALGADLSSSFKYLRTKAQAEEIVKSSGIKYILFRPSLIFGKQDSFTKNLKRVINFGPVVTIAGSGKTLFQPIYIEDWIKCFFIAIEKDYNKLYQFGGPEHLSYLEILKAFMEALKIKKPIINIPIGLVKMLIPFLYSARIFGVKVPEISRELLNMLQKNNITDIDSVEKEFGFKPQKFKDFLLLIV